jgi:hypothetical protein
VQNFLHAGRPSHVPDWHQHARPRDHVLSHLSIIGLHSCQFCSPSGSIIQCHRSVKLWIQIPLQRRRMCHRSGIGRRRRRKRRSIAGPGPILWKFGQRFCPRAFSHACRFLSWQRRYFNTRSHEHISRDTIPLCRHVWGP